MSSELTQPLSDDELASLGPLPNPDVESPTTSLVGLTSGSSAEIHLPGVAASPRSAAGEDALPDPIPFREEK